MQEAAKKGDSLDTVHAASSVIDVVRSKVATVMLRSALRMMAEGVLDNNELGISLADVRAGLGLGGPASTTRRKDWLKADLTFVRGGRGAWWWS